VPIKEPAQNQVAGKSRIPVDFQEATQRYFQDHRTLLNHCCEDPRYKCNKLHGAGPFFRRRQEFPNILLNPKVFYRVHKSRPLITLPEPYFSGVQRTVGDYGYLRLYKSRHPLLKPNIIHPSLKLKRRHSLFKLKSRHPLLKP
jgi:hypothetical protein